jgi:DNA-binding transcriptional MerR regulator
MARTIVTVKQLSDLAGVTIRTLHYYDQIGLLKPSSVGANGYRYYEEAALYRLQQILFYRELEIPLDKIKRMMERPDFDVLASLESHRSALQAEARRLQRLVRTVETTKNHLKGRVNMNPGALFDGFSEAEQQKYAQEASEKWDAKTVKASNDRWKAYSPAQKKRILEEGQAIYGDLAAAMPKGAESKQVQAIVARWHAHMKCFWSPTDGQLLGLADLYNDDARFRTNYEKVSPGLAGFMRRAVQVYVRNRRA